MASLCDMNDNTAAEVASLLAPLPSLQLQAKSPSLPPPPRSFFLFYFSLKTTLNSWFIYFICVASYYSIIAQEEYFNQLISSRRCHGLLVKHNGTFGKGPSQKQSFFLSKAKIFLVIVVIQPLLFSSFGSIGVYANSEFQEDELILKDEILVGIQHSSNKVTSTCSFFFFKFSSFLIHLTCLNHLPSPGGLFGLQFLFPIHRISRETNREETLFQEHGPLWLLWWWWFWKQYFKS